MGRTVACFASGHVFLARWVFGGFLGGGADGGWCAILRRLAPRAPVVHRVGTRKVP